MMNFHPFVVCYGACCLLAACQKKNFGTQISLIWPDFWTFDGKNQAKSAFVRVCPRPIWIVLQELGIDCYCRPVPARKSVTVA